MAPNPDLLRLAAALEYVDLAAGLYLAGGADHAARLLAAAGEQELGELVRLIETSDATLEMREMLDRIARAHRPTIVGPRHAHPPAWDVEPTHTDATRDEAAAFLRASWFMLEAMGLAALAPERLRQAVDNSTVLTGSGALEPFV